MSTSIDRDSVEYLDAIPGFWDAADAVQDWIDAHPGKLHNVSTIARGAKIAHPQAVRVLGYLDRHRHVVAEGNGCWRKYAARP